MTRAPCWLVLVSLIVLAPLAETTAHARDEPNAPSERDEPGPAPLTVTPPATRPVTPPVAPAPAPAPRRLPRAKRRVRAKPAARPEARAAAGSAKPTEYRFDAVRLGGRLVAPAASIIDARRRLSRGSLLFLRAIFVRRTRASVDDPAL